MTRKIYRTLMATMAACLLAFSSLGHAQAIDETPSALAMAGDALFVRYCGMCLHKLNMGLCLEGFLAGMLVLLLLQLLCLVRPVVHQH